MATAGAIRPHWTTFVHFSDTYGPWFILVLGSLLSYNHHSKHVHFIFSVRFRWERPSWKDCSWALLAKRDWSHRWPFGAWCPHKQLDCTQVQYGEARKQEGQASVAYSCMTEAKLAMWKTARMCQDILSYPSVDFWNAFNTFQYSSIYNYILLITWTKPPRHSHCHVRPTPVCLSIFSLTIGK